MELQTSEAKHGAQLEINRKLCVRAQFENDSKTRNIYKSVRNQLNDDKQHFSHVKTFL